MIFSELSGAYYAAVAEILKAAVDHPLSRSEVRGIAARLAFSESALSIEPALFDERWRLLKADGTTPIKRAPSVPLTELQKRWLKAVSLDRRIRLFDFSVPGLDGVEPLFTPDDVCVFDRYSDGDPYESEAYIQNFRLILGAVKSRTPLVLSFVSTKGAKIRMVLLPERLEYSEKDDKFRLIGESRNCSATVNLARILAVEPYSGSRLNFYRAPAAPPAASVLFELTDERNALERALLHFAHFEKEAERIDGSRCLIRLRYDPADETELVIRTLSFGPFIRALEPERFVELIKERLRKQKSCGLK